MPSEPEPTPDTGLDEWCKTYAPALPVRVEAIVSEWNLCTPGERELVVRSLLNAVRQSVAT
jgi:hypothetical protein